MGSFMGQMSSPSPPNHQYESTEENDPNQEESSTGLTSPPPPTDSRGGGDGALTPPLRHQHPLHWSSDVLTDLQASFAILNPAFCCKVGRLGTVVAVVISRVITEWKRDHELARLLGYLCQHNIS